MKKKHLILLSMLLHCFLFNAQTWSNIGPDGGFFKDFVINPTNSNIVYAGSDDGGGVWKSYDGGLSWSILTSNYPTFTGWHIEMDLAHPDTLYFCDLYGRYGILKTTDGGNTFSHLTNGFILNKDKQTSSLIIYPGTTDTLFISTGESPASDARLGNGVFSSFDGGLNWNYAGLQNISTPTINVSDNGRILVGTYQAGLMYSDDLGQNWNAHGSIPNNSTVHIIDKKDGVIAIGCDSGVYISIDNGLNFFNSGLAGNYNLDIAIIETTPNLTIISSGFTGPQIYNSATGVWSPISSPLFTNQLAMGFGTNGTDVYCGIFSSTQILKSSDGGVSWSALADNPICTEVPAVEIDASGKIYTALQNSYNMSGTMYNKESVAYSTNNGLSWTRTGPLAHGLDLAIDPSNQNTVYLATFAQGLFKSTDGFSSWVNIRAGNKLINNIELDPDSINSLLICETDLSTLFTGIFKSTNNGNTWNQVFFQTVNRVAYKPLSDTVFAAVENNGIWLSSDKGNTWSVSPQYLAGKNILSLKVNGNTLYAGSEDGKLYRISSSGIVSDISGPWSSTLPVEVKNILVKGTTLFVGLNGAEQDTLHNLMGSLWSSIDGGSSWTNINTNLTNTNIFGPSGLAMTPSNELLVATYGQGVFKSNGLILSILNETINNKIKIFPNPATTEINVSLLGNVNLLPTNISIYNNIGQLIYTRHLLSESLKINTQNWNKGIYVIQITDDIGNSSTKKVIVQ